MIWTSPSLNCVLAGWSWVSAASTWTKRPRVQIQPVLSIKMFRMKHCFGKRMKFSRWPFNDLTFLYFNGDSYIWRFDLSIISSGASPSVGVSLFSFFSPPDAPIGPGQLPLQPQRRSLNQSCVSIISNPEIPLCPRCICSDALMYYWWKPGRPAVTN